MPTWIRRFGQRVTRPAPSQAPSVAAPISRISVAMSTSMIVIEIRAWATVGSMWPISSVPGIRPSGTSFSTL